MELKDIQLLYSMNIQLLDSMKRAMARQAEAERGKRAEMMMAR